MGALNIQTLKSVMQHFREKRHFNQYSNLGRRIADISGDSHEGSFLFQRLSMLITNRSFQHAAPHLSNKLPHSFREPHPHPGLSPSHYPTQVGSTLLLPPFSPSIAPSLFYSRL